MSNVFLHTKSKETAFNMDIADVSLSETPLAISEYLGLSSAERAKWAWYELSGAVLSQYLVDQSQRFDALINWFYQDIGFCSRPDYFSVNAADLANCILSRQGNSTTLGVCLTLLAKQLDIPSDIILLPGQTLIQVELNQQKHYIDPLTGKYVDRHYMHALVRGELGNAAALKPSYLKAASTQQIITRMLHELKSGAIVSKQYEVAMEVCNLLLTWYSDDVHLHRERAFIAQQLGCINLAAADLQFFIEQNPDDPLTELVKIQLRELSEQPETYH